MSSFNVKVGKSAKPGAKPPAEKEPRPIHKGLDLTTAPEGYRCRECGVYFDMVDKNQEYCRCGVWYQVSVHLRFVRFDSREYLPGTGPVLGRGRP